MRRVDLDIFFFFFFSLPLSKRSAKLWKSTSRPLSLSSLRRMEMITGGGSVSQKFRRDFNRREKKRFNNPAQMDVRRMIEHPRIRVRRDDEFHNSRAREFSYETLLQGGEKKRGEDGKISRLSFRFSRCERETLYCVRIIDAAGN